VLDPLVNVGSDLPVIDLDPMRGLPPHPPTAPVPQGQQTVVGGPLSEQLAGDGHRVRRWRKDQSVLTQVDAVLAVLIAHHAAAPSTQVAGSSDSGGHGLGCRAGGSA
jgi:hypothetical protein